MDSRVRAALLAIFTLGSLGTLAELLLLEHFEESWQWTPIALIAASLLTLGAHAAARRRGTLRAFQGLMLLFAAGGLAGTLLHYRGNVEFEREMHPNGTFLELFRGAMTGATPALAPGTMVLLGSIGFLYTYGHPALARPERLGTTANEEET
jgi:hypothetical protein